MRAILIILLAALATAMPTQAGIQDCGGVLPIEMQNYDCYAYAAALGPSEAAYDGISEFYCEYREYGNPTTECWFPEQNTDCYETRVTCTDENLNNRIDRLREIINNLSPLCSVPTDCLPCDGVSTCGEIGTDLYDYALETADWLVNDYIPNLCIVQEAPDVQNCIDGGAVTPPFDVGYEAIVLVNAALALADEPEELDELALILIDAADCAIYRMTGIFSNPC